MMSFLKNLVSTEPKKGSGPSEASRPSPLRGLNFAEQLAALMPKSQQQPAGGKPKSHKTSAAKPKASPKAQDPSVETGDEAPEVLGEAPEPGVLGGPGLDVDPAIGMAHARDLVAKGLRDESALTDEVFYKLFPWLDGVKLGAGSAEAAAWLVVRELAVRPVLAEPPKEKDKDKPSEDEQAPSDAPADKATDADSNATPSDAPAPVVPDVAPDPDSQLCDTVGKGGKNHAPDVAWVTKKLTGAGLAVGSGEKELGAAIKTYEKRALNRSKSATSKVTPGDYLHHALIAGARPAPINVANPGALVETSSAPEVVALRKEVAAMRVFRDSIQTDSGEEAGARDGADADKRDALVEKIAQLRARIGGLSLVGVDPEEARAIRAWGYRQVNELSPYYSQGRNANILESSGATRTCNLTSLAMTLEALGVSSSNYTGDVAVLEQIRSASTAQGGATKKELDKAWGQNKEKSGVSGLRMPDFLQLVAIAHQMEKGKKLSKAIELAWKNILSAEFLRTYATKFGVNAWLRYGAGHESGKSKAQMWQETFGAELDAGRQVIVLLPGHFVRLQAVTEEGLIVDDPATGKKKNRPMTFAEVKTSKLVVLG